MNYRPHIWMADGEEPVNHIADWKLVLKRLWAEEAVKQGATVYWADESPVPVHAIGLDGKIFETEIYGTRVNHNFK